MPGVRQTVSGVAQTVSGVASTNLIESWEANSLANYVTNDGGWSVVQDAAEARHGQYYLAGTSAGNFRVIGSESLPNQPAAGTEWRTWMKMTSGSSSTSLYVGNIFGLQDVNNDVDQPGYRARWEPHDTTLYLQVDPDGAGFDILAQNFSVSSYTAGDWVEMRVFWPADPTSTAIEVEMYDDQGTSMGAVSSTDGSASGGFTDGGWGFIHNNALQVGEEFRVDYSRFI